MLVVAYTNMYVPRCWAGAQTTLRDLLRPLVAAGHDVHVVIESPETDTAEYIHEGVTVHRLTDKRLALHWVPQADIVITHLAATVRGALLGERFNVPVVHLVHNDRPETAHFLSYRNDLTVYNSQWLADHYGNAYEPSIIVHPPVDPAEYATTPGDLVTLINLWPEKGAEIFYALAERMPDVKFLGVAGGYGEQLHRDLPNVELVDQTEHMREAVYAHTRILLMPSRYESFGRVAVEVAASGIPTIAHQTPGLTESLGEAGIWADLDDLDAWEKQIRRLLKPRAYGAASKRSLARSAELAELSAQQLLVWADAIELVGGGHGTG